MQAAALPGRVLAVRAALLFALLAAAYLFSAGLRATNAAAITGDEPFYLLTTQSLIDDHNLDLREQYERQSYLEFFDHPDGLWKQSLPGADGRLLSPHEPGLAALLIPGFVLGGLRGAQLELLLIAAATFALAFVLAARETGAPRAAWLITAAAGLAAPAFVYSTEIYPEIPAAFCVVVALLLLRSRRPATPLLLACVLTALAWLGMKYAPLAAVLAGAYLLRAPNRSRAALVVLGVASAGVYAWAHLAWFGALTPYNNNTVYEGAATSAVLDSHLAFDGRLYRLWGLFIDRRFGLGRWAPFLLAVLPALPLLLSREAALGRVVAALVAVQLGMATFVAITMMGWWFPGRMLMPVYPLFAVVLAVAWSHAPRALQFAGAAAAGYSLAVTGALAAAGHARDVRIAVDPFAMDAPLFRLAGPLFPDYRWWSLETNVLTAVWLVAFAVAAAAPWLPAALGLAARLRPRTTRTPAHPREVA